MIGLLVKDFLLIFQRKQTLLMFLVISMVMGFSIGGSFIVGYMCLLSIMLAVGTISYDDADNGLLFLLACPVSRREYVLSKYILGGIVLAASWLVGLGFLFALEIVQGIPFRVESKLVEAAAYLPVILLVFCLMIPMQLKYGPEKSRLMIMLLGGGLVGGVFLLTKVLGDSFDLDAIVRTLDSVPDGAFLTAGTVISILGLMISIGVSSRIMNHKKL